MSREMRWAPKGTEGALLAQRAPAELTSHCRLVTCMAKSYHRESTVALSRLDEQVHQVHPWGFGAREAAVSGKQFG